MASATTTIKVSNALRDRIAERARRQHTTLAAAIESALDAAGEQEFWTAVREENAALATDEEAGYAANATLGDNLTDPDDDALAAEDAW